MEYGANQKSDVDSKQQGYSNPGADYKQPHQKSQSQPKLSEEIVFLKEARQSSLRGNPNPQTLEEVFSDLRQLTESLLTCHLDHYPKAIIAYRYLTSHRISQLRESYKNSQYDKLTKTQEYYLNKLSRAIGRLSAHQEEEQEASFEDLKEEESILQELKCESFEDLKFLPGNLESELNNAKSTLKELEGERETLNHNMFMHQFIPNKVSIPKLKSSIDDKDKEIADKKKLVTDLNEQLRKANNGIEKIDSINARVRAKRFDFGDVLELLPTNGGVSDPFLYVMNDFKQLLGKYDISRYEFLERYQELYELIYDSLRWADGEEPNLPDQYFLEYLQIQYKEMCSAETIKGMRIYRNEISKLLDGEISFSDPQANARSQEFHSKFEIIKRKHYQFHRDSKDMLSNIITCYADFVEDKEDRLSYGTYLWNNGRFYNGKHYDRRPGWYIRLKRWFKLRTNQRADARGADQIRDATIDLMQEFALIDGSIVTELKKCLDKFTFYPGEECHYGEETLNFCYRAYKLVQKGYYQELYNKSEIYKKQLSTFYKIDYKCDAIKESFNNLFEIFAYADKDTNPRNDPGLEELITHLQRLGIDTGKLMIDLESYVNPRLLDIKTSVDKQLTKLRSQIHRLAGVLALPYQLQEATGAGALFFPTIVSEDKAAAEVDPPSKAKSLSHSESGLISISNSDSSDSKDEKSIAEIDPPSKTKSLSHSESGLISISNSDSSDSKDEKSIAEIDPPSKTKSLSHSESGLISISNSDSKDEKSADVLITAEASPDNKKTETIAKLPPKQPKPAHPFFSLPYQVQSDKTSLLIVDDEGRIINRINLSCDILTLVAAWGLGINEGVVAGVGTGQIALGVPTALLGTISNYAIVVDSINAVLHTLRSGSLLKDAQGKPISKGKKLTVYLLVGGAAASALCFAALGYESCANQVAIPLLTDFGASKLKATIIGSAMALGPVFFIFVGMAALLAVSGVDLVKNTKWVHIEKYFNKHYRVPWSELSAWEKVSMIPRGLVKLVANGVGLGAAALYSYLDYKVFKGQLPVLLNKIPGMKASTELIASKILSGANAGLFGIFNSRNTMKISQALTLRRASKFFAHVICLSVTFALGIVSLLRWPFRSKESESLVGRWVRGINKTINNNIDGETRSYLEEECDNQPQEKRKRNAIQKKCGVVQGIKSVSYFIANGFNAYGQAGVAGNAGNSLEISLAGFGAGSMTMSTDGSLKLAKAKEVKPTKVQSDKLGSAEGDVVVPEDKSIVITPSRPDVLDEKHSQSSTPVTGEGDNEGTKASDGLVTIQPHSSSIVDHKLTSSSASKEGQAGLPDPVTVTKPQNTKRYSPGLLGHAPALKSPHSTEPSKQVWLKRKRYTMFINSELLRNRRNRRYQAAHPQQTGKGGAPVEGSSHAVYSH